jgi:protein SCO1/2
MGAVMLLELLLIKCRVPEAQAGTETLPYYQTADFSPQFLPDAEAAKVITHTIAPFAFTNQDGLTITDKDIAGKIHVASFIFTSCGSICPKMTEQMSRVAKAFERDSNVVILSYSVTPWIDTPEQLKNYKEANRITKTNWHFLTGSKAAIYDLARRSYFAEESLGLTKDSTEFLHTEHFVLVDRDKKIRGIYNGTLQLEAEQLIRDISFLRNHP